MQLRKPQDFAEISRDLR